MLEPVTCNALGSIPLNMAEPTYCPFWGLFCSQLQLAVPVDKSWLQPLLTAALRAVEPLAPPEGPCSSTLIPICALGLGLTWVCWVLVGATTAWAAVQQWGMGTCSERDSREAMTQRMASIPLPGGKPALQHVCHYPLPPPPSLTDRHKPGL